MQLTLRRLLMKREISPLITALFLIVGCFVLRLLNNYYPNFLPNVSPLMAVAYVGAMYLPRAWGWLVGPFVFLVTDLAFVQTNLVTDGAMFSWLTLVMLVLYVMAGGFGLWIAQRKSLTKILSGSLLCSLLFYIVTNTFSWWHNTDYAPTFAGWWQALTVGLPGYLPTWTFLRNSALGDLFFALLLLLVLDRGLLFGHASARPAARAASV